MNRRGSLNVEHPKPETPLGTPLKTSVTDKFIDKRTDMDLIKY